MGDQIGTWKAMRIERQRKRKAKCEAAPAILKAAGLSFSKHNEAAHLIVYGKRDTADFWPGTTRWILRKTLKRGFGIESLIEVLTNDKA